MDKNKSNAENKQEKLAHIGESPKIKDFNKVHNANKEGLGPNTKR